jgi:hypothetical protein
MMISLDSDLHLAYLEQIRMGEYQCQNLVAN